MKQTLIMTHHAKKRFSQNFLKNDFLIKNIVNFIHPSPKETLIEIGPGLGALTALLSQKVNQLHVIEIDEILVKLLQQNSYVKHLIIHHQDVLDFDFHSLTSPQKIVGNLPYHISTPLLFKLLSNKHRISGMYFMLQKELAERLFAANGSSRYGQLSVLLQYHFAIEPLLEIPPEAFSPRPKVDSLFIRLLPITPQISVHNWSFFVSLVKEAFHMRRKTLLNNLKSQLNKNDLISLDIDASSRPQEISVHQYVELSNFLVHRQLKK
ncbi:MAG: 16S rRNA (adenine(1518)-N(6)/adenine(1519)-N(6))-dimethyltransferase [Francisella sp.]|jgi:dimethyladenosine transferase|nr:MAG: 16S rRNA (adenine(1518)-N(6)/adenine(1519)-N(6))-dimethyltransferase [Francisella sp.]